MKSPHKRVRRSSRYTKSRTRATPDEYLAGLTDNKRAALEALREAIRTATPDPEECISYGIPAFRLNGTLLVGYGAAANHCAFSPDQR